MHRPIATLCALLGLCTSAMGQEVPPVVGGETPRAALGVPAVLAPSSSLAMSRRVGTTTASPFALLAGPSWPWVVPVGVEGLIPEASTQSLDEPRPSLGVEPVPGVAVSPFAALAGVGTRAVGVVPADAGAVRPSVHPVLAFPRSARTGGAHAAPGHPFGAAEGIAAQLAVSNVPEEVVAQRGDERDGRVPSLPMGRAAKPVQSGRPGESLRTQRVALASSDAASVVGGGIPGGVEGSAPAFARPTPWLESAGAQAHPVEGFAPMAVLGSLAPVADDAPMPSQASGVRPDDSQATTTSAVQARAPVGALGEKPSRIAGTFALVSQGSVPVSSSRTVETSQAKGHGAGVAGGVEPVARLGALPERAQGHDGTLAPSQSPSAAQASVAGVAMPKVAAGATVGVVPTPRSGVRAGSPEGQAPQPAQGAVADAAVGQVPPGAQPTPLGMALADTPKAAKGMVSASSQRVANVGWSGGETPNGAPAGAPGYAPAAAPLVPFATLPVLAEGDVPDVARPTASIVSGAQPVAVAPSDRPGASDRTASFTAALGDAPVTAASRDAGFAPGREALEPTGHAPLVAGVGVWSLGFGEVPGFGASMVANDALGGVPIASARASHPTQALGVHPMDWPAMWSQPSLVEVAAFAQPTPWAVIPASVPQSAKGTSGKASDAVAAVMAVGSAPDGAKGRSPVLALGWVAAPSHRVQTMVPSGAGVVPRAAGSLDATGVEVALGAFKTPGRLGEVLVAQSVQPHLVGHQPAVPSQARVAAARDGLAVEEAASSVVYTWADDLSAEPVALTVAQTRPPMPSP